MLAKYAWKITKVSEELCEDLHDELGTVGPHNADLDLLDINQTRFRIYDDDGEFYYEGILGGDYTGFEPLDDFGGPYAGCTVIARLHAELPDRLIDLVMEKVDAGWWVAL
jgi:hypothetical protein